MTDSPTPDFSLRRMRYADLPGVLSIERQSFSNPWPEATFRGEIQNEGLSFPLVAIDKDGSTVLGYVLYWLIQDEVQINNVAVHPDYRGRRLGERMMWEALAEARQSGGTHAVLEVRASNAAARTLYEKKLGFVFLGIRKDYYTNPLEDALVLGLTME
jgi:ribosomal-protein-alanine N-acetyltransferase